MQELIRIRKNCILARNPHAYAADAAYSSAWIAQSLSFFEILMTGYRSVFVRSTPRTLFVIPLVFCLLAIIAPLPLIDHGDDLDGKYAVCTRNSCICVMFIWKNFTENAVWEQSCCAENSEMCFHHCLHPWFKVSASLKICNKTQDGEHVIWIGWRRQ